MIEIPGYRLLRPLGHGGMATVYLAIQESVDREVALKVMSPALLVDPDFGARFLREARIAARLHHRHVVGIHDVGRAGDHHYIAMEFLAAGPLLDGDGRPRGLAFSLRIVREIADALAYVHDHGYVHRDVKSDNILLRRDGSAAITDFGIARANDGSTRITRAGTVVGTPHYMSPEQARGRVIDGRADLYSLGIVLHELLTGRVPYTADDSVAVGIRHVNDPLPQLPVALAAVQPLLDRLLAKDPAQRFQSGHEVCAAIDALQIQPDSAAASVGPPTAVKTGTADAVLAVNERVQPRLGALDDLRRDGLIDRPAPRSGPRGPRRRLRVGWWLGAVVVLAVAAGLWASQDQLRALLPETELNRLLVQGQRALAEDRISGSADAALESFRRARELEQDNEVARTGLASVADRLLARGLDAVAAGDLATARAALANVRDLRGGGPAIDDLANRIRRSESDSDDQENLLAAADAALAEGRVLGTGGAVAGYRKLQAGDPGNAIARAGLLKAAGVLAAQASAALESGDLSTLASRIDDIAGVLPDYPGLADLRGQLASARERLKADNERLLAEAQDQLRAGVVSDGGDSALALYRRVLSRDAGNAGARDGLRRVAQALLVRADAAIEDRDVDRAASLLEQAASLAPASEDLRHAQGRLRDLRESAAIAAERPAPSAADAERIRQLVEQGRAAAQRGELMDPPRSSAYDHYRAALALDPGNVAALDGLAELPALAGRRYEQRYAAGDFSAALAELEVLRQLAPADPMLARHSAQLLQGCLDRAATSIGERRRGDAQRALALVRRLDPRNPSLAGLEREVALLPGD